MRLQPWYVAVRLTDGRIGGMARGSRPGFDPSTEQVVLVEGDAPPDDREVRWTGSVFEAAAPAVRAAWMAEDDSAAAARVALGRIERALMLFLLRRLLGRDPTEQERLDARTAFVQAYRDVGVTTP